MHRASVFFRRRHEAPTLTASQTQQFWAWCADRGVTCPRPLHIQHDPTKGNVLVLREKLPKHGSVIAAVPYYCCYPSQQHQKNSVMMSLPSATKQGAVLNAETVPLGAVPPLLPLPVDILRHWTVRLAKIKRRTEATKKMQTVERRSGKGEDRDHVAADRYELLLSTFGLEEAKFLWMAGLVACAACGGDPATTLLRKQYAPYFDLIFSPSSMNDNHDDDSVIQSLASRFFGVDDDKNNKNNQQQDLLTEAKTQRIAAIREHFTHLTRVHELAAQSVSAVMQRRARKLGRRRFRLCDEPTKFVNDNVDGDASSSSSSSSSRRGNNNDDVLLKIPSGKLVYRCLRLVLSRAITIRAGCPPTTTTAAASSSSSDQQPQKQEGKNNNSNKMITIGVAMDDHDDDDDDDGGEEKVELLPSLVPLVDLLNHAPPHEANVQLVSSEVEESGGVFVTRRLVALSTRPIEEGEPLTISYNMKSDGDGKNGAGRIEAATLSAFRFGFC